MEAAIEAVLFVSSEPVPRTKLLELFEEGEREQAAEALEAVLARYAPAEGAEGRGVLVEDVGGGVRLATRPEVVGWLRRFFDVADLPKEGRALIKVQAETGSRTLLSFIPVAITTDWKESPKFRAPKQP